MLVAIATTKVPILMELGFWEMAHAARTDWSMLLGSMYLVAVGPGRWSLDADGGRKKRTGDSAGAHHLSLTRRLLL